MAGWERRRLAAEAQRCACRRYVGAGRYGARRSPASTASPDSGARSPCQGTVGRRRPATGIDVVRARKGCPQDNGGHERMHMDLKARLQRHPAWTKAEQQLQYDRWRHAFNDHRPHDALGGRTQPVLSTQPSAVIGRGVPMRLETTRGLGEGRRRNRRRPWRPAGRALLFFAGSALGAVRGLALATTCR